jgi:hypothetical protein
MGSKIRQFAIEEHLQAFTDAIVPIQHKKRVVVRL